MEFRDFNFNFNDDIDIDLDVNYEDNSDYEKTDDFDLNNGADYYLFQILSIPKFYETEDYHFYIFHEFEYQFYAIQKHWYLSRDLIKKHFSILHQLDVTRSGEPYDSVLIDSDFLPKHLCLSIISFTL